MAVEFAACLVISGMRMVVRRQFGLMLFVASLALVGAACTVTSESGGAQEPIMEPAAATTEAGSNAVSGCRDRSTDV